MNWSNTIAASCRYGDCAATVYGAMEVLVEVSERGYQGGASVLLWDGDKVHYIEWSYGSCSGCDAWEQAGLTDEQVAAEIQGSSIVMSFDEAVAWAKLLPGNEHWQSTLLDTPALILQALRGLAVRLERRDLFDAPGSGPEDLEEAEYANTLRGIV